MHLHPILLGSVLLDLLGVLLMLSAGWKAYKIMAGWQPESPTPAQLTLERTAETAASQMNWTLLLNGFSTLLLIISISNALPSIVPGAMCGTGVMMAAEPFGRQALWLRGMALAILFWQHVIGRLNGHSPEALLAKTHARSMLIALPLVVLSFYCTVRFTGALDPKQAVDCCAVVYDAARSGLAADSASPVGGKVYLLAAWAFGGVILMALGVRTAVTGGMDQRRLGSVLVVMTTSWAPLAFLSLKDHLCVYFYQVLAHHCPWCLLLPEHRFVGFPLYGLLFVIWLEGPAAALCIRLGTAYPPLSTASERRCRRAGMTIASACGGFFLITLLPALWWRWSYGVWMG